LPLRSQHLVDMMQCRDNVGGRELLRKAGQEVALEFADSAMHHLAHQVLTTSDVMEHRGVGKPNIAGDGLKAQSVGPVLTQSLLRRRQDRLASVLRR
jgi:hypothetical protein